MLVFGLGRVTFGTRRRVSAAALISRSLTESLNAPAPSFGDLAFSSLAQLQQRVDLRSIET